MDRAKNQLAGVSLKSLTGGKTPERKFLKDVSPLKRGYQSRKDKFYKLDEIAKSVLPRKSKAYKNFQKSIQNKRSRITSNKNQFKTDPGKRVVFITPKNTNQKADYSDSEARDSTKSRFGFFSNIKNLFTGRKSKF